MKDGRFAIVTSVRGLPLGVRDELQTLFGSQKLDIADPGAEFQAAGAVVNPRLPLRRLVAAGCTIDYCVMYYERGGVARTWHVAPFTGRRPSVASSGAVPRQADHESEICDFRVMSKILIVEDEPDIALGLRLDLANEGYQVEVVADGEEASRRAREPIWDLILLDVMLPGKDGFEICRELRRAKVKTPVLMLTARTHEAEKVLEASIWARTTTSPSRPARASFAPVSGR